MNNADKESWQDGSVSLKKGLAFVEPARLKLTDQTRPRFLLDPCSRNKAGFAPGKNCNGQRKSDCLIKAELCNGRWPALMQHDFCPVL